TYYVLLCSLLAACMVFPYSVVFTSILRVEVNAEIREESLKTAPILIPVIVNLFRDAILPYIIVQRHTTLQRVGPIAYLLFFYFATFNLAKSFIVINSLCLMMALVQDWRKLLLCVLLFSVPTL